MSRPLERTLRALLLLTVAALSARCAHARRPVTPPPDSSGVPHGSAPPVTRVVDPDPAAPKCTSYSIDGVSLGMPLSEVEKLNGIGVAPPHEPPLPGYGEATYYLRARRPGRRDEVLIALDGKENDSKVVGLRATIVVSKKDTWPLSLFKLAGKPKEASFSRWAWWDGTCGAAMLLNKIDPLGPAGEGQMYVLEIQPLP